MIAGSGSGESPRTISAKGPPGAWIVTPRSAPGVRPTIGPPRDGAPGRQAVGEPNPSGRGRAAAPPGGASASEVNDSFADALSMSVPGWSTARAASVHRAPQPAGSTAE